MAAAAVRNPSHLLLSRSSSSRTLSPIPKPSAFCSSKKVSLKIRTTVPTVHFAVAGTELSEAVTATKKRSTFEIQTLNTWLLKQEQAGNIDGELTIVLSSISMACRQIAPLVQRAGTSNLTVSIQGEDQKKLDIVSNEVCLNYLKSSGRTGIIPSEEEEEDVPVAEEQRYSAVSTGSTFSIHNSNDECLADVDDDSTKAQPPPLPDLQITNDFIRSLCQNPQIEALAFLYYRKAITQPGFHLEPQTLNLLLKTMVRNKQWSFISNICQDFRSLDVFPDQTTCRKLISSGFRSRKLKLVHSMLEVLEAKTGAAVPAAYAAVMRGYNKLHMYRSTISVFIRMISVGISPDAKCCYLIMDAHRKLGNAQMVLFLFLKFCSEKRADVAASVLIYPVLCDSLGRSGRAVESLHYFREMTEKGINPTRGLYESLISAFARIKHADAAWSLYQEAKEQGMVTNPEVLQKLVLMYVDLDLVEKTVGIVKEMMEMRIKVTDCILCAIVNGFSKRRGLRSSIRVYEQLKSLGCEPGQVTYSSMINVHCRLGLCLEAESLFMQMLERGFDKCLIAYSNIIYMYGKNGRAREAMRVLAKMKEKGCKPNVWVYNSLMDAHGRLHDLKQVEKLWTEMKRRGITPDRISYTTIISAYSRVRLYDECVKLYDECKMNEGKVDKALAGIMVGVFSKANRADDLVKLLKEMKEDGAVLDERLYSSALNAFRDSGLQIHVKWFEENFTFENMDKT
ncbi:Pentatricopeptide repeat-containing protein [Apostasia shenzhenica]|uniref:Pentatricopeptide repeat-containing protein n=1 Tax=Apostasia shenzhenica TaxID=1088818 RepID=A0A2I0AHQ5_9ASPA|nr:Pentatricopeptide repeat-containing protein [Apostasia shenzhenica]